MAGEGGSTALSQLEPYQQNTHFALIGGGVSEAPDTSSGTDRPDGTSNLPGGIIDFVADALAGGNPYTNAFVYDPDGDLEEIQEGVTAFQSLVNSLDPETDFTSYLALAVTGVDSVMSSTYIDDEVDAFENSTANQFARSINRVTAPLSDINAANGSAFAIAMVLAESDRQNELNAYRAKLGVQREGIRAQLSAQFAAELNQMLSRKLESQRVASQLQSDASRTRIIASKEYLAEEIELDYRDLTYDLELFGYANATLAAGLGAAQRPIGPSKASTALATSLSAGTTLASLGGQVSMPLGIGLGAVGFLGTYLTNLQ